MRHPSNCRGGWLDVDVECPVCQADSPEKDGWCPECQGELPEHGQGCGWVAEQMADHAYDMAKERDDS